MKTKYFLMCLLFIVTQNLLSQNLIDPPIIESLQSPPESVFDLNNSNVIHRMNNDFILGWNYGEKGRALDILLKSNHYLQHWETGMNYVWNEYGDNHKWYMRLWPLATGSDISVVQTQAIYYEPTLNVNRSDNFIPDDNNTGGAVFGFQYKDQNLTTSSNAIVVDGDESTTLPILSNVWPKDELKFLNKYGNLPDYEGHGDGDQRYYFDGRSMYLSINLKGSHKPLTNLDNPVLKLKIKIWTRNTDNGTLKEDYVKFDTLPNSQLITITSSLGNIRGMSRVEGLPPAPTKEFLITPRMLGTNGDEPDEYITLSAGFNCFYSPGIDPFNNGNFFNPYLKTSDMTTNYGDHNYAWVIDSMDIEVYYVPGTGVTCSIEWIKLETPKARDLFRGVHDQYIRNKFSQVYHQFTSNTSGQRLAGIYANDEYYKNLWASSRYLTRLLDGLSNSENDKFDTYPSQFLHSTGYNMFFNGKNISYGKEVAAPYYKLGDYEGNHCHTFGIMNGYKGRNNSSFEDLDVFKSQYETWAPGYTGDIPFSNNSHFEIEYPNNGYIYKYGTLYSNEWNIYHSYFKRKSMLFGNNRWVSWLFPISQKWGIDDNFSSFYVKSTRPLTGEEFVNAAFTPLAMGAKGLFYWIKNKPDEFKLNNDPYGDGELGLWTALLPTNNDTTILTFPQDESLLTDTRLTGDFIDVTYNDPYYEWQNHYNPNDYNWNLLGVPVNNRIYIGLNTLRTEIFKLHNWIDNNKGTLVNLRLMAWRGKGFSTLYQQADGLTSNYINKFIDISQIKTRPLGYERNGLPFYEQDMEQDSSFYDIMIHRIGETSLDDSLVIAVINRRTDPLVYVNDELPYQSEDQYEEGTFYSQDFKFYSTHEYDSFCDKGGNIINPFPNSEYIINTFKDAEYWRNLYWKRQGVREIRIKMKYEKPGTHDKVLLRVEELLAENEPLTNMNGTPGSTPEWWRQERWNNAVKDIVIRSDGELVLKMLPGSGRMFKVTVEKTQDIVGELANSNQTKIIAYPARQTSNQDYSGHDDSVYYHMVYHKKEPQTNKYNVYYTRSQHAYLHNTNTKTIQWRPGQKLANVLHVSQDIEPDFEDNITWVAGETCDCKYPTLTARFDTDNQIAKLYVVFNCQMGFIPDTQKVFIFERSFPIDAQNVEPTSQLDPIGYAYASAQLNGLMIDRWGIPAINASLSGNYYAWNDSIVGIKAGFKRPENSGYITNLISFKFNDNPNYNALFPSMNTFSMIPYYDDNAGLAWQETTNEFLPNASSKIYYTMLRIDQNYDIYNYVPLNTCDPGQPLFNDYIYSNDFKIACISPFPLITNYKFPQVYRNAESVFNENNEVLAKGAGDRVYWQGTQDGLSLSSIYIKMIDLNLGADCFNCLYPKKIYDAVDNLGQVNAGPGDLLINGNPDDFNWSDSSYIVNFVRYASGLSQPNMIHIFTL